MIVSSTRINRVLSVLFIVSMGACGGFGSCGACGASAPLPAGGLPGSQTIEGGAQVRVTPGGLTKLTSIIPGVLNNAFAGGFCVAQGQVGSLGTFGTGARYCESNNVGCNPGCKVDVGLNNGGFHISVPNQNTMNIAISTHVATTVKIDGKVVGIGFSCTLGVTSNDLGGDFDIALGTRADNGELTINLANINQFNLNLDFSGCGPVSSVADLLSSILEGVVNSFIGQLLTPTINQLVQGFLPNPLGIASITNIGQLLAGVSPGTNANPGDADRPRRLREPRRQRHVARYHYRPQLRYRPHDPHGHPPRRRPVRQRARPVRAAVANAGLLDGAALAADGEPQRAHEPGEGVLARRGERLQRCR